MQFAGKWMEFEKKKKKNIQSEVPQTQKEEHGTCKAKDKEPIVHDSRETE